MSSAIVSAMQADKVGVPIRWRLFPAGALQVQGGQLLKLVGRSLPYTVRGTYTCWANYV